MCTVSVVPFGGGFRIACNRDEQRTRAVAEPPRRHPAAAGAAVWPVDPASGGTWVGVNDAGLAAVVLNRNPRVPCATPVTGLSRLQPGGSMVSRRSRGTIVPAMLREERFTAALDLVNSLPVDRFDPFTLVLIQGGAVAVVSAIGGKLSIHASVLTRPLFLTSSSLGDHRVVGPRRALFARLLSRLADPVRAQSALHRHRWRRRPEISVVMSRKDAATVSRTVVDVTRGSIRMRYEPLAA